MIVRLTMSLTVICESHNVSHKNREWNQTPMWDSKCSPAHVLGEVAGKTGPASQKMTNFGSETEPDLIPSLMRRPWNATQCFTVEQCSKF